MNDGSKPKKQPTGDYEVGYCKTAKHTRWQPGQSGNPKGRARRRRSGDIAECTNNLLEETRWAEIDGKRRRITNAEGVARVRLKEAFESEPGAARDIYRWQREHRERDPIEQETVITATLVFPEEENRLVQLAQENSDLRERLAQLESELGRASGSRLPAGPSGSAIGSNSP
jgi:hypothetical protein